MRERETRRHVYVDAFVLSKALVEDVRITIWVTEHASR